MKFNKITIIDDTKIPKLVLDTIAEHSKEMIVFDNDPTPEEVINRIGNSDCIMLTWRTPITKSVLDKCNLKLICLCATNSNCIDLEECTKKGITISNVSDYGDEGVVEFVLCQLLNLVRGFGKYKLDKIPCELSNKTIGILGMGTVGKLLAKACLGMNMKVLYYDLKRDYNIEKLGVLYNEKTDLLIESDFIVLQTPKNIKVLDKTDFKKMKGKVLVNTTIGNAFDEDDFINWISQPNNFAIMDQAPGFASKFKDLQRVVISSGVSGITREARVRLGEKAKENIIAYLKGEPINKINK